jgi:hypothetical protein
MGTEPNPWASPSRALRRAARRFLPPKKQELSVTDLQELDTGSPDFAALNGSWLDDEGAMTPRMACWLWQATLVSADTWGFVADRKGIDESLPPIARPFAHGRWLHEFILGFDRLADRIASGRGDTDMLARCTAEELALHEIINLAEA